MAATETAQLRNRLGTIGERARVAVAEANERIVGYCAYGYATDDARACVNGAIYAVYVHPQRWYYGVGHRLLAAATEYLKLQGCSEATLFVYEETIRARRFSERAGWRGDGHREMYEHFDVARPVLRYRTAW